MVRLLYREIVKLNIMNIISIISVVLDVFDNDNKDVLFVVLPVCQYLAELLLHNNIPLHFLPLCEQVGVVGNFVAYIISV